MKPRCPSATDGSRPRATVLNRRIISAMRRLALTLAIAAGLSSPMSAQAGRSEVAEGNRLYEQGQFEEAYERYLEALREAPGSPAIRFDQGNALYRTEDYQRAAEAYEDAIETGDPSVAAAAWYNLGNALYRAQQLQGSLESYKSALRLDPSDIDAKHNLERAFEQMQQQEQQQQQPQDGESGEQDQTEQPEEGQSEDRQESQQGQQPGDEPDPEAPPDGGEENEPQEQGSPDPPDEEEGGQQPPPGGMSREEAERLLQAIQEDAGDVNRKPPQPVLGRIPRRVW